MKLHAVIYEPFICTTVYWYIICNRIIVENKNCPLNFWRKTIYLCRLGSGVHLEVQFRWSGKLAAVGGGGGAWALLSLVLASPSQGCPGHIPESEAFPCGLMEGMESVIDGTGCALLSSKYTGGLQGGGGS